MRARVGCVWVISALGCGAPASPGDDPSEARAPAGPDAGTQPAETAAPSATPRRGSAISSPGDTPVELYVQRLTERVYWVEPAVFTAVLLEVADGTMKLAPTSGRGLEIRELDELSIANRLGLRQGDVIVSVNQKEAAALAGLRDAWLGSPGRVELVVKRGAQTLDFRFVAHKTRVSAVKDNQARFAEVVADGIRVLDDRRRVIDAGIVKIIAERPGPAQNDQVTLFGPKGSRVRTIDGTAVGPGGLTFAVLDGKKAFEAELVLASGATATLQFEVVDGLLTEDEVATAKILAAESAPAKRERRSVEGPLKDLVDNGMEKTGARSWKIDRKRLDAVLADPSGVARQARIVPSLEDGKTVGFKLYGIRSGTLFAELGLKNGDQITRLGDVDMTGPDRALEAYSALKGSDEIVVTIKRKGTEIELKYRVE